MLTSNPKLQKMKKTACEYKEKLLLINKEIKKLMI